MVDTGRRFCCIECPKDLDGFFFSPSFNGLQFVFTDLARLTVLFFSFLIVRVCCVICPTLGVT